MRAPPMSRTGRPAASERTSVPKRSSRTARYRTISLLEEARRGRAREGMAPGEALALAMPEGDLRFAELPAEQEGGSVYLGREVDQPELDVLQLRPGALDVLHHAAQLLDERTRGRARADQRLARDRLRRHVQGGSCRMALGVPAQRTPLEALEQQREPGHLGVGLVDREDPPERHAAESSGSRQGSRGERALSDSGGWVTVRATMADEEPSELS